MTSSQNNPLAIQIGVDHYKSFAIQPIEFIHQNDIGFIAGCVIKRICRYNQPTGKGAQDLEKAIHEVAILRDQLLKGFYTPSPFTFPCDFPIQVSIFCDANQFTELQFSIVFGISTYNCSGLSGRLNGPRCLDDVMNNIRSLLNGIG
jgi:hypothetical protein